MRKKRENASNVGHAAKGMSACYNKDTWGLLECMLMMQHVPTALMDEICQYALLSLYAQLYLTVNWSDPF
jgi:hypothetical protein